MYGIQGSEFKALGFVLLGLEEAVGVRAKAHKGVRIWSFWLPGFRDLGTGVRV